MANRRMLAKSISISDQVAALDLFAALLFTWMIAHADDWGVLPGSPTKLRALVIPQLGAAVEHVMAALEAMEAQSLIWRYEWTDGTPYIQFRTWEQHQDIHKRTAPRSPRYCDLPGNSPDSAPASPHVQEVPGNDGKFPPKRREEKRREENLTQENLTQVANSTADAETRARVEPAGDSSGGGGGDLTAQVLAITGLKPQDSETLATCLAVYHARDPAKIRAEAAVAVEWARKKQQPITVKFINAWLARTFRAEDADHGPPGAGRAATDGRNGRGGAVRQANPPSAAANGGAPQHGRYEAFVRRS